MVKESWEIEMEDWPSWPVPRVFSSEPTLKSLARNSVDLQTRLDAVKLLLLKRLPDDHGPHQQAA